MGGKYTLPKKNDQREGRIPVKKLMNNQELSNKEKLLNNQKNQLKSEIEMYQKWTEEKKALLEAVENGLEQLQTNARSENYPFKEEV